MRVQDISIYNTADKRLEQFFGCIWHQDSDPSKSDEELVDRWFSGFGREFAELIADDLHALAQRDMSDAQLWEALDTQYRCEASRKHLGITAKDWIKQHEQRLRLNLADESNPA